MHWTSTLVFLTLLATGPSSGDEAQPDPGALEVRYIANEGFLVEGDGQRVLIDALFGSGISGYDAAPAELRSQLEQGTGEWGGVQVALATHFHGDHFSAEAVGRFLAANPEAQFLSTPQAIALLAQSLPEDSSLLARARAVFPDEGRVESVDINGISIEVFNLHHGASTPPIENLGFVVTLGNRRFLHFGDTEAKMPDFEPYLDRLRGTELAILPFWFLSSEWRASLVRDELGPRWVVVGHTPKPDAPAGYFARWRSYDNLIQVMLEAFPDAKLPDQAGQVFRFDSR